MNISKGCYKYPEILKIAVKYCESVEAKEISYITVLDMSEFRVIFTNKNGIGEAKILSINN